ncbi:MAG: tetratricopeptide repeat protein [Microcystis panniformis]
MTHILTSHKRLITLTALVVVGGVTLLVYPSVRDESHWWQTTRQDTAEAYLAYQKALPQGKHLTEAKTLYEDRFWKEVQSTSTIKSVEDYIREHPQSPHLSAAKKRLEELYWKQAQGSNTVTSYQQYLAKYPSGQFVEQAKEKIYQLTPLNPNEIFARNVGASQTKSGIKVEILRVLVGRKSVIKSNHPQLHANDLIPVITAMEQPFDEGTTVGAITFRITNNWNQPITFFPSNIVVSTVGKQINLEEYVYRKHTTFGDAFTGKILPGATSVFGIWFDVGNASVPAIKRMNIALGEAYRQQSDAAYIAQTGNFFFSIDLSKHNFEPFPEKLN